MFTNSTLAEKIQKQLLDVSHLLETSILEVEKSCNAEEATAYKRAVGKIVTQILFDLVEPIYESNPSIKPEGWDD
jgi:hypothetical protein